MSATLCKNKSFFEENAIDLDFIKANEVVKSHGPHHYPIAHSLILDKFRAKADQLGLKLINEKGALSKTGERYMYVAEVEDKSHPEFNLSIGFRSFNDRSVSFQGSCGISVMICSNGCQTSVIVPSKQKHTIGNFGKLDEKIGIIFDRFNTDGKKTVELINKLKNIPYSDELLGKFILALGRDGTIGNTNIMKILAEVDNPTLNDKNDHSAWRIHNAMTYVTTHRMTNPITAMNASRHMNDILMKCIDSEFTPIGDIIDIGDNGEVLNIGV